MISLWRKWIGRKTPGTKTAGKVGSHSLHSFFGCPSALFVLSVKPSILNATIQNTCSLSASVLQVMLMQAISQCASLHVSHSSPLWSFTIGCIFNHLAQKSTLTMVKGVSHQTLSFEHVKLSLKLASRISVCMLKHFRGVYWSKRTHNCLILTCSWIRFVE